MPTPEIRAIQLIYLLLRLDKQFALLGKSLVERQVDRRLDAQDFKFRVSEAAELTRFGLPKLRGQLRLATRGFHPFVHVPHFFQRPSFGDHPAGKVNRAFAQAALEEVAPEIRTAG